MPSGVDSSESIGLSSGEALKRLHQEIESQLNNCGCQSHGEKGLILWITEAFSHNSIGSTFRWPSALLVLIGSFVFFIGYIYGDEVTLLVESFILFSILCLNAALVGWDTRQCHREIHKKAKLVGQTIKSDLVENISPEDLEGWTSGQFYPNVHLPQSPCITLQWTLRDGNKVNLPTVLLVKEDVIFLCPGSRAPGPCRNLEPVNSGCADSYTNSNDLELKAGDIFIPTADQCNDNFTSARLRRTVKPVKFLMIEAPFASVLRLSLEKSWQRPKTLYEKERHTIIAKYIEQIIVPLIGVVVLLTSFLHYGYLRAHERNIDNWANTTLLVMLRPTLAILPLLPLALPVSWLVLNAYGVAHLLHVSASSDAIYSFKQTNLREKQSNKELYFDDLDTDVVPSFMTWRELYHNLVGLILSRNGNLWRSANLLQVLGSLTALCCIDKKGILSWPNPVPDKVFFLTTPPAKKLSDSSDSTDNKATDSDVSGDIASNDMRHKIKRSDDHLKKRKTKYFSKPEASILDITHDPHNALGLQFDDPEWRRYLPNLKPLGLGILLNTCCPEAQEEYTQFCDHIACESLHNEAAVPVINRRCLCDLARNIGFTETAMKEYQYLFQVALFRHVKPEVIQQGKLAKSLNNPRLKMPFPNMASAVIKDVYTSTYQLFSQGTGDLVLDACTEFWDGQDLCILSDVDRKRILDFYHRSSLTALCMAFSYVPLSDCPDRRLISDYYLELPPDSSHLFPSQKSLDSSVRSWDQMVVLGKSVLDHYMSNESLVMKKTNSRKTSVRPKSASSTAPPEVDNFHVESLTTQISNEVFIGMVTMQYSACPDFVQLIEQLDNACIRFVHFSKENELRSRVFSEKMGLESGWNCHISLSDDHRGENSFFPSPFNRTGMRGSKSSQLNEPYSGANSALPRSQSAPSAVNLETTVVKFIEGEVVVAINREQEYLDGNYANQGQGDQISLTSTENSEMSENQREAVSLVGSCSEKEMLDSSKADANISPSPSRITDSTATENSAPIAFDMSNRAKLPKGIENIRPHLEKTDNVPLLVSLFTDCTPETSCEMISIMQEYGEVVCVLGSSANIYNIPTFLQADASIAIEPLYPQVCVTKPVMGSATYSNLQLSEKFISPTELAKQLNSLPCSLSFHREDPVSLSRLIMEARHYMINVRNSLQFLLCCSLSLSLAQLLTSLLFLPPLLSPGHMLWLVCIVLPILSMSLMATPLDSQVMTIATGKNLNLSRESIIYFLFCYLIKFSPSILIIVTCFALMVRSSCRRTNFNVNTPGPCWMFIDISVSRSDTLWSTQLLMSQTFVAFLLVLYFVVISVGFVHRSHLLWQRSPLSNRWWLCLSLGLLLAHSIFCFCEMYLFIPFPGRAIELLAAIPLPIIILSFVWPLILVSINSLIKRHELKAYLRQQRRARLEFNTKLGMNSPF